MIVVPLLFGVGEDKGINVANCLFILPNPQKICFILVIYRYKKTMRKMLGTCKMSRCTMSKKPGWNMVMIGGHGSKMRFNEWAPSNKGKVPNFQGYVVMSKGATAWMSTTIECSCKWCTTLTSRTLHKVPIEIVSFLFSFSLFFLVSSSFKSLRTMLHPSIGGPQ